MMQPAEKPLWISFLSCLTALLLLSVGSSSAGAQPSAETQPTASVDPLPDTALLTATGDLNDRILSGSSRFLDQQLAAARVARHQRLSQILRSSPDVRDTALSDLRLRLQYIIGGDDARLPDTTPTTIAPVGEPVELASGGGLIVHELRWPVLEGLEAEGILVLPARPTPRGTIILLPDADTDPAALAGLLDGNDDASAGMALQLASTGCQVIIPRTISRQVEPRLGRAQLTDREYVYRATYVLGRHPLGLEVQSVRALVDWLRRPSSQQPSGDAEPATPAASPAPQPSPTSPLAVAGHGEGGLVALLTAAVDTRIDAALVSGIWGNRDQMWREPLSRNVFGLLDQFGDAELACLIGPRALVIEAAHGPELRIDGSGAAPGQLVSPTLAQVEQAAARVRQAFGEPLPWLHIIDPPQPRFGSAAACAALLQAMDAVPAADGLPDRAELLRAVAAGVRRVPDRQASRQRQLRQIEALSQRWIRTSRKQRDAMRASLDMQSLESYRSSTEPLRARLEQEVLGRFDQPLLAPAARSRFWRKTPTWSGWEVEMDVFPDVIAGGILLLPKGAAADQPRPVVVCVHGLEGRPSDGIIGDHRAYHDFAARLCDRGFVVFCPQQLYRGGDDFRVLQRKANPLGKTLFSIIIPQHRQIVRWLQSLPQVDPQRIGFYGLSYGGKSAMRIPAVVTEYGPTICSGDFNEWVLKNVSTEDRFSYVGTGEYEIFEFDLAGSFNYAEMAALICPRPFMVERGHFDGVADDRWVAFEYAPVRYLYAARLGIPERTEIEWFVGPHTINGQGTFDFLHRHLQWPQPTAEASAEPR